MIIQCQKCETRFRFDDRLLEEDGVWVRCSRCQHVFFQERAADDHTATKPEIPSVRISDAKRTPEERFPVEEERLPTEIASEISPQPKVDAETLPVEFEKEPSFEEPGADLQQESIGGPAADTAKAEEIEDAD